MHTMKKEIKRFWRFEENPEKIQVKSEKWSGRFSNFGASSRNKKILSNPVTKSAGICINAVLPEKIRHFEKIKNIFSWI